MRVTHHITKNVITGQTKADVYQGNVWISCNSKNRILEMLDRLLA